MRLTLPFLEPARVHAAWAGGWHALRRRRAAAAGAAAPADAEPPFYGYAVFVLSTLISLATYSSTIDVLGLFFASFVSDLGLSRSAITSLLLVGTLLCGLLQPYTGALVDRHGARAVACASMLVHAAGLLILAGARGPASLGLAFVVIRVGGISGTFLAVDAALTKWFVRNRGTAVAVQRCVMAALAVSAIPMAIGAAVPRLGWRGTLAALAAPLLVAVPTAGVLMLPTPEAIGLHPDGDKGGAPRPAHARPSGGVAAAEAADGEELLPLWREDAAAGALDAAPDCSAAASASASAQQHAAAAAAPPAEAPGGEVQWSVREACRCRAFWVLLLIGFAVCCCTGGITAHCALIAADAGLDLHDMSRAILAPSAAVALVANFAAGRVLDRNAVSVRALFAFSEACLAAAALAAGAMGAAATPRRRTATAALFGGLYGGGTGVYYFMYKLAFSKFFGRAHIGAVMGWANAVMFAAIGLGPVLFGVARDRSGAYAGALRAAAGTCAAAAVLSWLLVVPPVRRPLAAAGGGDAAAGPLGGVGLPRWGGGGDARRDRAPLLLRGGGGVDEAVPAADAADQ